MVLLTADGYTLVHLQRVPVLACANINICRALLPSSTFKAQSSDSPRLSGDENTSSAVRATVCARSLPR